MKIVQLGANKGDDELAKHIKKNYDKLDFALFVEANPLHIEDLKKCYAGYENVFIENIAVKPISYEQDTLKLYYYEDDAPLYAVTSCIKSHIEKHYGHFNYSEDKLHQFEVPALTIDELFLKYNIQELDWLLLDVEGIDAELLLDTDWSKYKIKKIEYEKLHLGENKNPIENIFKELGYVKTNSLHHYDDAWIKSNGENKMNITLYAICKNEEKNVEKFIETSKKFSHTVVVDTGSTDKTVELLKEAGIEVYYHPQSREEFDFSKVRNQALSYVKTDWAFSLDLNEDLDEFFPEGLGVISTEFTGFNHERYDKVGDQEPTLSQTAHIRFHRTKNYTWVSAVHETPIFIPTEEHLNESAVDTTIKITKNVHNTVDKQLFYLSICEREFEKDPTNTYYLWFIFKHYFEVKNFNKALELGQEYLNLSRAYFDPTRIDVFIMSSMLLLSTQDIQRAANYAFHAVSEAMNVGGDSMGKAFSHLLKIGQLTQNPNIIVFASAFAQETLGLKERTDAIDKLFLTNLDDTPATAWSGHRGFAEKLVRFLNPKVIVDLGVDWGYSTFSFALPRIGHTYGIDNFVGDDFVGTDENRLKYNFVTMKREKLHLQDNLTLIEGDFNEVAQTWDKTIDILHIDGSHKYEDIKRDFETWSKFVTDNGIILLHDTCIESLHGNEYGVKKFFDELDMPKFTFTHCFGLGVICKNEVVLNHIKNNFT
jgi:FkbM family methyltransferase